MTCDTAKYWNDVAGPDWAAMQAESDAQFGPIGRLLLERVAPLEGERVLDVGCGAGQTLLELSELVGADGRVIGIDVAAPLVACARARAKDRSNVSIRLADAESHAFAPNSFDLAFSRFGTMFFADPSRAFRNLREALAEGGRLGFVCWQTLAQNPWASVPLAAAAKLVEVPLDSGGPGPFSLSDPKRVRLLLDDAGFTDIAIELATLGVHFGGASTLEQAVAFAMRIGPAATFARTANANLRDALARELRTALSPYASERGVRLDAAVMIVTARSRRSTTS